MARVFIQFWRLLRSIAAAAFGVQSQQHLEHDFARPGPWALVIGGLLATLLLVLSLWWLVEQLIARAA